MRGYASYARAQATRAYMNRVRVQFKEAIVNKLSHGLSDCHIEALLLWHAGFQPNPHVLEELRLKGLIKKGTASFEQIEYEIKDYARRLRGEVSNG